MKLEIGYFSKSYYDEKKPTAGGFFPFVLEGTVHSVVDVTGIELYNNMDKFLIAWMKNIHALPIYCCMLIYSEDEKAFEQQCKELNVDYAYVTRNVNYSIASVQLENDNHLQNMLPLLIGIALTMNDLILWSTNKNVFRVEQRQWVGADDGKLDDAVIVNMEPDTTVFWVSYDGDSIVIISNEAQFATYETIIQTFPHFIQPSLVEYEQ